ncbi:MAG: polyprenol monophosphomannose synthase [Candidatus Omnitrophota bacterium]|jgi:dolichol-phosphate mannosyltransferase
MKVLIVTPTYNEAKNIVLLHQLVRSECVETKPDILVVDSASPDGTARVVRQLQQSDPNLFLLEQKAKLGLGRAYLDGMTWALAKDYDCLITMDADISHHPKYINELIHASKEHELVIGSRYAKGGKLENWPRYRLFLSQFANGYARILTGLPFHDLTSGFQCFRISLLRKILRYNIHTEGYAFLVELKFLSILQQATFEEIPIIFTDRTYGDSKISKRVIGESMLFVMKLASQRGRVKQILASMGSPT